MAQLLMTPWDDEPVTEEEQAAVREGLKEPGIPLEQVRRELLGGARGCGGSLSARRL